ncbi:FAD binding domain-containing protein [Dichotomocladium elegans]|nr:FAD binding domain-containing protein [Dichotomocladium elegans]
MKQTDKVLSFLCLSRSLLLSRYNPLPFHYSSMMNHSDVLIVGAGPTGLYAGLLLNQMGLSVHIIDKRSPSTPSGNPNYIWSPRSLQLFHAFDLVTTLTDRGGMRHWRLETYTNKGYGNAAETTERQNHSVWESDATEFSWSMTCECDLVCNTLSEALEDRGVQVLYGYELVDMETDPIDEWVTSQIATPYETYSWKSSIVIGADGANSMVRQKLGIAYERTKSSRVFYTIEATVSTNFPSAKSMASISKDENTVFTVGHTNNKMYISFEHRPKWSRLTIDDDLPLTLAQKHVKSILEPYQIDFIQVHSYRRWLGGGRACEEYAASRRYFLAGGAAQTLTPEGMLGADLGLEQVHNLCWKVALTLKRRGSPQLLETYDEECRSKLSDAQSASHALVHLLSYNYSTRSANSGLNSTHNRELGYQLHRNKHSIVGETPYHANLVNIDTISTLSLTNSDIFQVAAAAAAVSARAQRRVHPGTPGTLAHNSKLKPYTMFNLLVAQTSKPSSSPSSTKTDGTAPRPLPAPKSGPGVRWRRTRSNSVTSNSNSTAARFRVPFLTIKAKRSNSANGAASHTTTTTRAAAAAASSLAAPFSGGTLSAIASNNAMDRWRMIKTNHFRIIDRMWSTSAPFAFNLLVFAGPITDRDHLALLQRFRRHLEEPHSFIQRYEKLSYPFGHIINSSNTTTSSFQQQQQLLLQQENGSRWGSSNSATRSSYTSSLNSSKTSLRLSSCFSPPTSPTSTNGTIRSSIDQPRPSLDSALDRCPSTARPSISAGTNNNNTSAPHPSSSNALFSFLYITSSSRTDVSKFLSVTQPAVVHATFPLGLDRVYLDHDQHSHSAFDIKQCPTVIVIRPDGYICARIELQNDLDFDRLDQYFDVFLRPPVDMTSAAALAADYYDL